MIFSPVQVHACPGRDVVCVAVPSSLLVLSDDGTGLSLLVGGAMTDHTVQLRLVGVDRRVAFDVVVEVSIHECEDFVAVLACELPFVDGILTFARLITRGDA